MFPVFAEVPAYPLVFAVFWGAVAYFALAMARHLRIFAAARAAGPSPLSNIPARTLGLIRYAFVQTKMFRRAAGLRTPDLLGIRADDRHGRHRHRRDHQAVPWRRTTDSSGGGQRDAEHRRRDRLVSIAGPTCVGW
jgi:hypothetical protein